MPARHTAYILQDHLADILSIPSNSSPHTGHGQIMKAVFIDSDYNWFEDALVDDGQTAGMKLVIHTIN